VIFGGAPVSPTPVQPTAAVAPTPAAPTQAAPSRSAPDIGGASSPWKTVGWVVGGAGGVGLGVGAVFGVLTLGDKSSAHCGSDNLCDPGTSSGIKSAALISDLGWIAGGVLLASGAALVLFTPSGSRDGTAGVRVAPIVTASGGEVVVAGGWGCAEHVGGARRGSSRGARCTFRRSPAANSSLASAVWEIGPGTEGKTRRLGMAPVRAAVRSQARPAGAAREDRGALVVVVVRAVGWMRGRAAEVTVAAVR